MFNEDNKAFSHIIKNYKHSKDKEDMSRNLERVVAGIIYISCLRPNINESNPLSTIEILCLIFAALGKDVDECANILGITESSFRTYEKRIRKKLKAKSRTNAFYIAILKGYITVMR